MAASNVVLVGASDAVLTKEQKAFNRLTSKIAKQGKQARVCFLVTSVQADQLTSNTRTSMSDFFSMGMQCLRNLSSSSLGV